MENYALFILKRELRRVEWDCQSQGVGEGQLDYRPSYAAQLSDAINTLIEVDNERKVRGG